MHDLVIGLFINRYELEYQFESQTPDLEQRPCFIDPTLDSSDSLCQA